MNQSKESLCVLTPRHRNFFQVFEAGVFEELLPEISWNAHTGFADGVAFPRFHFKPDIVGKRWIGTNAAFESLELLAFVGPVAAKIVGVEVE